MIEVVDDFPVARVDVQARKPLVLAAPPPTWLSVR
jgi:hypothetical protein